MSSYFPATAYEPVPEYDHNGYPLQPQQSYSYEAGGTAGAQYASPPTWSQHTSYLSQTSTSYEDHEALLKQQQQQQQQQQQYTPQPLQQSSQPETPQSAHPDAPTHRESLLFQPPVNHQLRHQYRKTKQFRRMFTRIMGRWLLSVAFAGAIVGIFILYERMGIQNANEKHMFNALYLGVSLLMALNMVVRSECSAMYGC
jgi:hypothetical protein